jgi:hypothetical protein
LIVSVRESSPVVETSTTSIASLQSGVVTHRTCRRPPVCFALSSNARSTLAAHRGMRGRMSLERSGTSAART